MIAIIVKIIAIGVIHSDLQILFRMSKATTNQTIIAATVLICTLVSPLIKDEILLV